MEKTETAPPLPPKKNFEKILKQVLAIGILTQLKSAEVPMTWSKASTSTQSFTVGAGDYGTINAVSGTGTGVLEEFVAFLVTRGWTANLSEFADFPATGDTTWQWALEKNAVCEDGGTQKLSWALRYEEHAGATDEYTLYSRNAASGSYTSSIHDDTIINTVNLLNYAAGKWSFWTSDEDSDSFLVIAEDTTEDCVIGFWPPSGSLFRQGFAGTSSGVTYAGIKPLFLTTAPSWEAAASSASTTMDTKFTNATYKDYMNDDELKTDFAWMSNSYARPLFRVFGGDVGMFVQMGPTAASPVVGNTPQLNGNTSVYQFGSDYHIAWGQGSKLLFNCGTTAPVF